MTEIADGVVMHVMHSARVVVSRIERDLRRIFRAGESGSMSGKVQVIRALNRGKICWRSRRRSLLSLIDCCFCRDRRCFGSLGLFLLLDVLRVDEGRKPGRVSVLYRSVEVVVPPGVARVKNHEQVVGESATQCNKSCRDG